MAESGIDLGFDLEFDLNLHLFNENDSNMDFLPNVTVAGSTENVEFYELKSTRSLRTDEIPSFKTATPTSRTQLKLQLQREQQQQEQQQLLLQQQQHVQDQTVLNGYNMSDNCMESDAIDANSASGSGASSLNQHLDGQRERQQTSSPVTLKMPLQSIGVDVPPQVLQVSTVLENPTRYHVIQKQKNQVRQYLSESFKPSIWGCQNFESFQNKSANTSVSSRNLQCASSSSVLDKTGLGERPRNFGAGDSNGYQKRSLHSADSDSIHLSPFGNCGSSFYGSSSIDQVAEVDAPQKSSYQRAGREGNVISNPAGGGVINTMRDSNYSSTSTASPVQPGARSAPLSPSLSSVATSASELPSFDSDAEDLFDDILQNDSFNFDKNFNSELSIKQEPQNLTDAEINALAKDRQKKDNHNMSKLYLKESQR